MNVWFTSDTHFGHDSMVTKGWRPQFQSVWDMDETMIDNWNAVVGPKDQVWHLGDFSNGVSGEYISDVVDRLKGDIHLIAGNHDSVWPGHRDAHKRQRDWLDMGFASVQAFARRKIAGRQVLMSHFPYVGDHTEGDRYNEYRLNDTGLWLLHGHVHELWTARNRQINVGVDVWNFQPVSLDVLTALMEWQESEGY